jgi:acyl carrier protein
VVSQEKPWLPVDELRTYAKEKLPDYMVPAAFVMLDAFPLTANGKLDRDSLPKPDARGCERESVFVAPQTDLEKKLAAVWQELLQVRQIGLHDNFFDLGGHSLLLIHLHNHLKKSLGANLSIVDLFEYPTVSSLAKFLGRRPCDPILAANYQPNQAQTEQRKMRMAQQRQQRRQLAGNT